MCTALRKQTRSKAGEEEEVSEVIHFDCGIIYMDLLFPNIHIISLLNIQAPFIQSQHISGNFKIWYSPIFSMVLKI